LCHRAEAKSSQVKPPFWTEADIAAAPLAETKYLAGKYLAGNGTELSWNFQKTRLPSADLYD
jgi:hypothetical protein